MKVHIGCSGWNYRDWRGKFYPEKMSQKDWLNHYADKFDTVEVNNTFYKFPKDRTLGNWRDTVSSGFRFSLKGSRYISHMKKLGDVKESVRKFETAAGIMKRKLGCILWQLPGNLHRDDEKLEKFCQTLDVRHKHVIEFRHESWFNQNIYTILRNNKVSCCSISSPDFPEEMIVTGKTGYVRFHGKGKQWYDYHYSVKELQEWYKMIMDTGVREVFIYFNNDIGGNAPKNAMQMKELFG